MSLLAVHYSISNTFCNMFVKNSVEFHEKKKKSTFNQNFIFPRIEEGQIFQTRRPRWNRRKKKKSSSIKFTSIPAPLKKKIYTIRLERVLLKLF